MNVKKCVVLSWLLISLSIFISCSQEEIDQSSILTDSGKLVNVKLNLGGDILELGNILTRGSSDDLFGIRISYAPLDRDYYSPYAQGLYDDIDLAMNLSLITGYKYQISATLIRNGKNVIAREPEEGEMFGALYLTPFEMELQNKLDYVSRHYNNVDYPGEYIHHRYQYLPDVDRYYGILDSYIPSVDNTMVLSMKRVSTRLVFNVNKLIGYLTVAHSPYACDYLIEGNSNGQPFQTTRIKSLMGGSYDPFSQEWLSYPIQDCQMQVTWHREDGTDIIIENGALVLQAGKTSTFNFDLSSYYSPGPGIEIPGEDDWD